MAQRQVTPKQFIEDEAKRNETFVKLTDDIRRRVHELATIFNVDVAVVIISPSGEVITISGKRSVEDVLLRYYRHHASVRGGHLIRNRQKMINRIKRKKLMDKLGEQLTRVEQLMDEGVDLQTFYAEYAQIWESMRLYKTEIAKLTNMNDPLLSGSFIEDVETCVRRISVRLEWTLSAITHCYMRVYGLNAGNAVPATLNNASTNVNKSTKASPNNFLPLSLSHISHKKFKFLNEPIPFNDVQGANGN